MTALFYVAAVCVLCSIVFAYQYGTKAYDSERERVVLIWCGGVCLGLGLGIVLVNLIGNLTCVCR